MFGTKELIYLLPKRLLLKKNECLSRAKGNKYTMFGSCIDKEGHSVSLSGGKSRKRRSGRRKTIKKRSRRHKSRSRS